HRPCHGTPPVSTSRPLVGRHGSSVAARPEVALAAVRGLWTPCAPRRPVRKAVTVRAATRRPRGAPGRARGGRRRGGSTARAGARGAHRAGRRPRGHGGDDGRGPPPQRG